MSDRVTINYITSLKLGVHCLAVGKVITDRAALDDVHDVRWMRMHLLSAAGLEPALQRLPKVHFVPRSALTQKAIPIKVSDCDCAGMRHDRECRDRNSDRQ